MTDAELEGLEALLAKATTRPWKVDTTENVGKNWLICGGFGDDPDGTTPIITTDSLSGLQCITGLSSDDAKAMCASVMAAERMISTIRELRAENAELKRDRSPVTPAAIAWAKEEVARIEAKEAAKDRVVKAAREWCAADKEDGYGERVNAACRELYAALSALDQEDTP